MTLSAEQSLNTSGGYLMPTPKALDGEKGNLKTSQERLDAGNQVDLPNVAIDLAQDEKLFATPNTMDSLPPRFGEAYERVKNAGGRKNRESSGNLREQVIHVLPTPQVDDSKNTGHNQDRRTTLASEVWETERSTNWGKFEPAIRRWEQVLGRPAPAPTKPDGKEGAHRLSSAFTEWMMGLPEGWITDCGLSRNEELKACGNGVVPQQAELALRMLLDGINLNV